MYSRASSKIRVYTISDQDDSGPWIRKTFPGLFYIVSPGPHGGGAYHFATWSGASGDRFHGRFVGADFSLVDNPWPDENIRRKYFAARMDWTTKPYAQANHPPAPKLRTCARADGDTRPARRARWRPRDVAPAASSTSGTSTSRARGSWCPQAASWHRARGRCTSSWPSPITARHA